MLYEVITPGLKVIVPSNPYDAKGLLKSAIRDDDPIIFMESEQMYGDKGEVPEGEYTIPIGVAEVKRDRITSYNVCYTKLLRFLLLEFLQFSGPPAYNIHIKSAVQWH